MQDHDLRGIRGGSFHCEKPVEEKEPEEETDRERGTVRVLHHFFLANIRMAWVEICVVPALKRPVVDSVALELHAMILIDCLASSATCRY